MSQESEAKSPEAKPPETKPKKRVNPLVRAITIIVILIVVVIALIAGWRYAVYASAHESTDDAQVDADIVAVTSKISERVDSIKVDTNQYVHKGQVLIVLDNHDEKQRLDAALAVLNATHAQADAARQTVKLTADQVAAQTQQGNGSVDQARASIANSQAQVEAEEAQVKVAQAGVATAVAQLHAAQAVLPGVDQSERRSLADLHRTQSLVKTGDAPRSELDAALAAEATTRSSREQAMANVNVANANLAAAEQKVSAQRSSVAAANATVTSQTASLLSAQGKLSEADSPYRVASEQSNADASLAQVATQAAQVSQARDQLGYTVIKAPTDGYVGEKSVEVGKTVASGETLLTIVPTQNLYITANYKETQIGKMRPNQEVDITVDAYHGRTFTGHVVGVGPASQNTYSLIPAQNATGNFVKVTQRLPVRVVVDHGVDEHHPLRVGMSVETAVRVKE